MFTAIILIIIGTLLIVLNLRAINKEKDSFYGTLKDKQQYMDEVDEKIGSMRKEFAETIFELQKEMEYVKSNSYNVNPNYIKNNIKKDYNKEINAYKKNYKEESKVKLNIEDKCKDSKEVSNEKVEKQSVNTIKINEINEMLKKGLTIEEIAEKLEIGKGEVLLIKDLFIK